MGQNGLRSWDLESRVEPQCSQEGWDADWRRNLPKNRGKMGQNGLRSWDLESRVELQCSQEGWDTDWREICPKKGGKWVKMGSKLGFQV